MLAMASGLREQKKERTHDELVTTALRLFDAQGFDETTVEEIAEAVGVSPRTFFRYFPQKEDVLFADDGTNRGDEVLELLRQRDRDAEPALALQAALLEISPGYEEELPKLLLRKRIIAATPTLRTRALDRKAVWEASVLDELRTGRTSVAKALQLKVAVATTVAALNAAIDTWLESDGAADLTRLAEQAFAHLNAGNATTAGTAAKDALR
jgi:AcrR family transcriptional regulator